MTNKTNQVGACRRAEYSVKMLMHYFMEIRHWAKRQQIYKHLFAFDVLPQTRSHFKFAKWRRLYLHERHAGTLKKKKKKLHSDVVYIKLMDL